MADETPEEPAPERFWIRITPTTGRKPQWKWEAMEYRNGYFGDRTDEWAGYYPIRLPKKIVSHPDIDMKDAGGFAKSYGEAATAASNAVGHALAQDIREGLIDDFTKPQSVSRFIDG